MPYIKAEARVPIDKLAQHIAVVINHVSQENKISPSACTNYMLCRMFVDYVPRRYDAMSAFLASLRDAHDEIRRRWFADYENYKMLESGDIKPQAE